MGLFDGIRNFLFGDPNEPIEEAAQQQAAYSQQATQVQKEMQEKALAAEKEMFDKALAEAQRGNTQSLAALLAGGQTQYDLQRALAGREQSWMLPRQVAGMSALQALPQLQSALGIPSYAIPSSIDTTLPPEVNLLQAYQNALGGLGGINPPTPAGPLGGLTPEQIGQAIQAGMVTTPGTPATPGTTGGQTLWGGYGMQEGSVIMQNGQPYLVGPRSTAWGAANGGHPLIPLGGAGGTSGTGASTTFDQAKFQEALNKVMPKQPATDQTGTGSTGTTGKPAVTPSTPSSYSLQPSGQTFDMKASPLYQWQKDQQTTNINRALAARGIGGGAPAAAVLGQAYTQLGAEERERQVRDLMNLTSLGMGIAPQMNQAAQAGPGIIGTMGAQLSQQMGQGATQRAGLFQNYGQSLANAYTGMGNSQAQGLLNLGSIYGGAGQAMAQTPSAFGQLLGTGLSIYGLGQGAGWWGSGGGNTMLGTWAGGR